MLPYSTGQVSVPIHLLSNSQRLVFLLNSRFSLFSDNSKKRPELESLLIPKLQSNFAEFLQHSYLERLSMFYLSTCVGLGYGFQIYGYFFQKKLKHFIFIIIESRMFFDFCHTRLILSANTLVICLKVRISLR